ncbi:isochorismate synthase [Trifolium repens]|nr:isochorismate synthase [Trifolium repens]
MGRRKKRLEKRQYIEKPGREEGSYSFKRFSMKRKILLQGSNITMSVLILVSSSIVKFPKQAPPALIISSHNIPNKLDWNLAVNKALQIIERNDSSLSKVVLERSTRVVPTAIIDPLMWFACLKVLYSLESRLMSLIVR